VTASVNGSTGARQPSVAVVGGYGTAITFGVARAPVAGETLLAGSLRVDPGGKGSNQAVAARRLGARVSLLTAVGPDAFGDAGGRLWAQEGVDANHVRVAKLATMLGAILVEPGGENRIVVGMGALSELEVGDVGTFEDEIAGADVCVVSLEVPTAVAAEALAVAKRHDTLSVLNPAPPVELPASVVRQADVIVPNRFEAEFLSGSLPGTGPDVLVDRLRLRCDGWIVLTLGAEGAMIDDGSSRGAVPAPVPPRVVDTTGAGDAFTGALAAALALGLPLDEAVRVAVAAGSYSVTTASVVASLPHLSDLPDELRQRLSAGRSSS
jgi:ribokinase